jgi:three-Cys-motif partner protein
MVLVDAFAGEGKDASGNSGSPVFMGRAAIASVDRLKELDGREIAFQVVAIEKNRQRFGRLRDHMAQFGPCVRVLHGTLETFLDDLLQEFRGDPMLCFLDPFGVRGLDSETMRRGVADPGREILVLIDDDGARRLIRAATAIESHRSRRLVGDAAHLSLLEDPEARAARIAAERERSNVHLRKTGRAAASHLTRAIGSDAWREIANLPSKRQRESVVALFEQQLREWGACYTTRIPIRSAAGKPAYVLLHASRRPSGRSAMKEAVQGALNSDILPEEVCDRLRRDMRTNEDLIASIRAEFGGSIVPWTDRGVRCLKDFLMEETEAFPWQCKEVKRLLDASGWRLQGRKHTYAVPLHEPLQRAS